ncbi:hypothetical protein OIE75_29685 [Streptomyces sp. NBC_01723]|uniref:hypothetical protein n=1 Tax=Streptomyces sp. NBC_01723 TaxID=2975921 RepID=UPI002E35BC08|nr:hypothetical protein [Streptomyces sp. NBC_01723]
MNEDERRIASLRAELSDRAAENRELRREMARAGRYIDNGDIGSAKNLLQRLSLSASEGRTP